MIQYKLGVPVRPDGSPIGLHPRIEEEVLPLLSRLYSERGLDCTVTATSNGEHMKTSKHYEVPCRAVDVRTKNLPGEPDKYAIRAVLRQMLGPDYRVLYENPAGENQHLHVQLDVA